ncbi:hypothetical protein KIPB_011695 [Kipferlia bialata]|uniref:Uncharacterized protein n=1 Tax=Kipferlia bialata TaxID=797122 RepID=A0A391NX69_9EUKA|nr:hypothetical protein KIPB_011695 [Kipferlia bialata]|eukprot:g11695.t1
MVSPESPVGRHLHDMAGEVREMVAVLDEVHRDTVHKLKTVNDTADEWHAVFGEGAPMEAGTPYKVYESIVDKDREIDRLKAELAREKARNTVLSDTLKRR